MTDEEIIEIRDSLLPSQGEPFGCIAFARAVIVWEREECAKICDHEEVAADSSEFLWSASAAYIGRKIRARTITEHYHCPYGHEHSHLRLSLDGKCYCNGCWLRNGQLTEAVPLRTAAL